MFFKVPISQTEPNGTKLLITWEPLWTCRVNTYIIAGMESYLVGLLVSSVEDQGWFSWLGVCPPPHYWKCPSLKTIPRKKMYVTVVSISCSPLLLESPSGRLHQCPRLLSATPCGGQCVLEQDHMTCLCQCKTSGLDRSSNSQHLLPFSSSGMMEGGSPWMPRSLNN